MFHNVKFLLHTYNEKQWSTPPPPPVRANFNQGAFIWTNLVDTNKKMFHAKHLSSSSLGFFKRRFLSLYYTHIVTNNDTPGAGPVLTPGLLFEQTL
jgi:hypothetical protein